MKVAILGGGGHARTIINLLQLNKVEIEGVYDDNFDSNKEELIDSIPLKGTLDDVPLDCKVVIAKGEPKSIRLLADRFQAQLYQRNLIHPSAVIDSQNTGKCNQISAQSYLAKTVALGNGNIIYSNSSIEHEVSIGNNNVLTVNVTICGRVKIGNQCFFGASSTVLPYLTIADNVTIGAGAVVTKDILEAGTYVGIPAKRIK